MFNYLWRHRALLVLIMMAMVMVLPLQLVAVWWLLSLLVPRWIGQFVAALITNFMR